MLGVHPKGMEWFDLHNLPKSLKSQGLQATKIPVLIPWKHEFGVWTRGLSPVFLHNDFCRAQAFCSIWKHLQRPMTTHCLRGRYQKKCPLTGRDSSGLSQLCQSLQRFLHCFPLLPSALKWVVASSGRDVGSSWSGRENMNSASAARYLKLPRRTTAR